MIPPESPETTDNATPQQPRKADYQGATPEQVAEALLRYRPPEEGPKPEKSDRWL